MTWPELQCHAARCDDDVAGLSCLGHTLRLLITLHQILITLILITLITLITLIYVASDT